MTHIPIQFNDFDDGEPSSALEDRPVPLDLSSVRAEQKRWSQRPLTARLEVIRRLRHAIVDHAADLVRSQAPRDEAAAAEILSSQIIPLADACRFLEREAPAILRTRRLGPRGRPLWLTGTKAEIRREPCGVVLNIAPSNYPLFLMGVPLVQALAAGNAVLLKPAPGCSAAARQLQKLCLNSGLPVDLVRVLKDDIASLRAAAPAGVDKVLFTGSAATGRRVLAELTPHLVPATMELSGCDAMFVLEDADVTLAARSLLFGLGLNRGATCIAPRRVFVHESKARAFEGEIIYESKRRESWTMDSGNTATVAHLVVRAAAAGARLVVGEVDHHGSVIAPLILADANVNMPIMREDHFGPAAAIVTVTSEAEALQLNAKCPYALGASVFSGNESRAQDLAGRISAGSVVINDVIVPTADPRLPFGGRGESGYGVMRGAEGLLELTVPKVVVTHQGSLRRHLEPPSARQAEVLTQFLKLTHAPSWRRRLNAAWRLIRAERNSKHT